MTWPDATTTLVAASAAHAAFSAVVSVVVYPALVDGAREPGVDWPTRHDAHSRRIAWVVGPLYLLVAAACVRTLLDGPVGWAWVVLTGNAAAALLTAALAAPTHGRLGAHGPTPALLGRLLLADRLRTAAALVAGAASLLL